MAPRTRRARSRIAAIEWRRAAAFGVHLLTASGTVVGVFALFEAFAGNWTGMFAWLGLALAIDGIDGMLARRLDVAEVLPRWSGEVLDLVVDYLTYVLVPAVAIATGGLLPDALALPALVAILLSSAIYFADRDMKTEEGYFRGFPALWNVVAFYLFVLRPDPSIALALVVLFVVLTFVPMPFVHPLRVKKWSPFSLLMLVAWAGLAFAALFYFLTPPKLVIFGLLVSGLYFFAAGLARSVQTSS